MKSQTNKQLDMEKEVLNLLGNSKEKILFDEDQHKKVLNLLGNSGYFLLNIPNEYNGKGYSFKESIEFLYYLSKYSPSLAHILSSVNFGFAYLIFHYGTELQKKRFLPSLLNGELTAFAYHEEEENVGQPKTTIKKEGDTLVLNGEKSMISNISDGRFAIVHASYIDESDNITSTKLCIVDLNNPNVFKGKIKRLNGLKQVPVSDVSFKNYELSESDVIQNDKNGFEIVIELMTLSRIAVCALALGATSRLIDETYKMSRIHQINANPLISLPSFQSPMANCYSKYHLMKTLLFSIADRIDKKDINAVEDSLLAKIFIPEELKKIASEILQFHGGKTFLDENFIFNLYSDIRVMSIIGGTTEAMKDYWNYVYSPSSSFKS